MLKRILSISLMLVILVLNLGLTHITHYCGGEGVESAFSLVHSDISCGMTPSEMESCAFDIQNGDEIIQKKGCCENEYTSISAEIDYNKAPVSENNHFKFVLAFAYSFVANNLFLEKDKPTFKTYRPPFIDRDISVLHQVFII